MADPLSYRFIVEADPAGDALVRILAPFMVEGAVLEAVDHVLSDSFARTTIRAAGLAPDQARTMAERLGGLSIVRAVGFGWQGAPLALT